MSGKTTHDWVYDGGGGGHNGEYFFTCSRCGDSDWVSYASLREGQKPNAAGCKGAKPPAPPRSPMSPECVGRDMSPNGETPLKHTADCSLAAVLAKAGRR